VSNPTGPLTFATIGVSGYAGVLLDSLDPLVQRSEAKLLGATVRTRAKAAERCDLIEQRGGHIFSNWQAMVDAIGHRLDCLIVPTGIQDHCKMAVYALQRDINVLLEKPIAATLSEAQAIKKAAEESTAGLIIGYQDLYTDSTHAIKSLLLKGAIGSVQSVSAICLWPREDSYFARNSWVGRLRIGKDWVLDSPVNNAMGHFINLPLFWLGETSAESAPVEKLTGSLYRSRELESFDSAAIQIDTASGIPVYFHGSHACETCFGPEISIVGSEGTIHWKAHQNYTIQTPKKTLTEPLLSVTATRQLLFHNARGWLLGEPVHVATAEQALQQTRVVHLLHSGLGIETISGLHLVIDGGKRFINGLDNAFNRCFAESRLLAPSDAPWAAPVQSVSWTDVCYLTEPTL
jgi:predicted dehydrogenase